MGLLSEENQPNLHFAVPTVTIDTMTTKNTLSDILRQAILDSGLPLLRIEEETGVQRASISRFVRGERSLRLDLADELTAHFELTLTPTAKIPTPKKSRG